MEKIKVLMIEDDIELSNIIVEFLKKHSIDVESIDSPYIGLSKLDTNQYDLMILDLTLPDIDGIELIPMIREKSQIPIIISSARDDITDKIMGLERGADDYIPKPYDSRELVLRIKSILKRVNSSSESTEVASKIFDLDRDKMQIKFHEHIVTLTMAEYDILELLISRENGVVSRYDMIEYSEYIDDDSSIKSIDVMISRIRHKLNKIQKNTHITPVRGIGYKLIV